MNQGLRKIQEDGYYFCKVLDSTNTEYDSVFIIDGHGASSQDITMTDIIKATIEQEINRFFKKDIISSESIKKFFIRYDSFLASKHKRLGACCSAVFLSENIFISSIGDTRVRVYYDNKLIYKTPLHNFSNSKEVERYKKDGKIIKDKRYKGLTISRSLGDHDCKKLGETSLIPTPSVFQIKNDKKYTFVLTTDGDACIKDSDSILHHYNKNNIIGFLKAHEFKDNICVVVFSNSRFIKPVTQNSYVRFAKFIDRMFP